MHTKEQLGDNEISINCFFQFNAHRIFVITSGKCKMETLAMAVNVFCSTFESSKKRAKSEMTRRIDTLRFRYYYLFFSFSFFRMCKLHANETKYCLASPHHTVVQCYGSQ